MSLGGTPLTKKRRLTFALPTIAPKEGWSSEFNLDDKVETSQQEVGDGASSRVYIGSLYGNTVAVKQLKFYSPRLASGLVKSYERLFHLRHDNIVQVFGISPKAGYIVMEYCQKVIDGCTLRTLGDLLLYYGSDLPAQLRIAALSDVAEGLQYLHSQSLVHGDIKPHNVLVTGSEQEFLFKITDYACIMHNSSQLSSRSSSLKQLMTPGYVAPELISDMGTYVAPTKASDIYSFAILSYEVAFCCDPWPKVSMQLIESVRKGYRPVIPSDAPKFMSAIVQECWQHESSSRPHASQVSHLINEHLDKLTSGNIHVNANDAHDTEVLEGNTFSVSNDEELQSTIEDESHFSTPDCLSTLSKDVDTNPDDDLVVVDPSSSSYSAFDSEGVMPGSNLQITNVVESMQNESSHSLNSSSFNDTLSIDKIKSDLCIKEFKEFQIQVISAIGHGNDVILVQPTGSGKSICFMVPALLNPSKVCIVIEPLVAIINNQVETLQRKGIDALALGGIAGNLKTKNYRRVFKGGASDMPTLAFCTPEYLFGIPATSSSSGSPGQFHSLKAIQDTVSMIAVDEAHTIFGRMPDYRSAFDEMQQLKEMPCPILCMSATLTNSQVDLLKQKYVHSDKCLVVTKGVQRENLRLCLQRYRRRRLLHAELFIEDDDCDNESDKENETDPAPTSMWLDSVNKIEALFKNHSTVLYLDFARDVEEITDILKQKKIKAGRYTGQIKVDDQKQADRMFRKGETSVLVATESYELGVDNPNITQVIRIGCPRNLGVFLQEVGRAGRKPDCTAEGMLLFNECVDDKCLGQWLKKALVSSVTDPKVEAVKTEILFTYTQAWRYIYSIYNGKCLSQALANFHGGAGETDPPTCFIANNPLCSVCEVAEEICQVSVDIKEYLVVLLRAVKDLCETGLQSVTKTLLISVLLQSNEKYVRTFDSLQSIFEEEGSCWGCGVLVCGSKMSQPGWHKILYVAVHLSLMDLDFNFRPFENHYEVHRRYILSSSGLEFLQAPCTVMSVDPHSSIVDKLLGVAQRNSKRCNQNRGKQTKPRIVSALEGFCLEENIEALKFIGFGCESDTCIRFENCFSMQNASKDPHFLLNYIQLTRTQAATKEIQVVLDGVPTTLLCNKSYCSGVKMCAAENCTYTVSTKQRVNRCKDHPLMGLLPTGSCSCCLAYVYPPNATEDGRRWFVALNADSNSASNIHNHSLPSEWKILPNVVKDIEEVARRNASITPKELQKGTGMQYRPMQVSLAANNLHRIRAVVKRVRSDVDKIDNEKVNPFKIIASFPAVKERVDQTNGTEIAGIDRLIGKYQLDADDAYSFGRDRQYAWFQAPFQADQWSKADVLFVDIDHTGCHHFPYLLNVVCKNEFTQHYMACGRVLINRQDGVSIGNALSKLECNVKSLYKEYKIGEKHKEILLDFDDAEANAFMQAFGADIANIIRGCSVHFLRSAMRVAKLVNLPSSAGYHIFVSIAKRIPDERSQKTVIDAFDVLCGIKSFELFSIYLPPNLKSLKACDVDTSRWKDVQGWVDWWRKPNVLRKLSSAFSSLSSEEWDDLPGTTNPVESINRQSVPQNTKSISLKPLIEHFYLEDKRQAIMQLAALQNVTISYQVAKRKRSRRPPKAPESRGLLCVVPQGKRAIGTRVSVEFYDDDDGNANKYATKWYRGTIIAYSKQGHTVSFDGYGPEHNETIKSLRKSIESGEVKLL